MLLLILGSHCHVQFLLLINSNHLLGLENFPPFSFQCKWKNGALDLSASPEKNDASRLAFLKFMS
jgi:hypothetical protein